MSEIKRSQSQNFHKFAPEITARWIGEQLAAGAVLGYRYFTVTVANTTWQGNNTPTEHLITHEIVMSDVAPPVVKT